MAPKTVANRTCLVTGAASGIGRATAVATAARGGRLVLTDLNETGLTATAEQIRSSGGTVVFAKALDITDHEAVAAMADEVHAAHGSVDVVMNVAGVSAWGTVEALEHRHWKQMVDVNLMGPIHVIESFVPPMIAAGRGGHLVNVSSAAGLIALPWHAAYSASKFGLRGVSEVLRYDLRRHGIGVSLVCPGGVDTPLVDTIEIAGIDKNHPRVKKFTALFRKRADPPEHVAELILAAIERNRYLVLTSREIKVAHWFQRKFAPPYEIAMRLINNRFTAILESTKGERG